VCCVRRRLRTDLYFHLLFHRLDVVVPIVGHRIGNLAGPEGGDQGGKIVAQGTPKELIKIKESYTGQYLKKVLKN